MKKIPQNPNPGKGAIPPPAPDFSEKLAHMTSKAMQATAGWMVMADRAREASLCLQGALHLLSLKDDGERTYLLEAVAILEMTTERLETETARLDAMRKEEVMA